MDGIIVDRPDTESPPLVSAVPDTGLADVTLAETTDGIERADIPRESLPVEPSPHAVRSLLRTDTTNVAAIWSSPVQIAWRMDARTYMQVICASGDVVYVSSDPTLLTDVAMSNGAGSAIVTFTSPLTLPCYTGPLWARAKADAVVSVASVYTEGN